MALTTSYTDRHLESDAAKGYADLYRDGYFEKQFTTVERPLVSSVLQSLGLERSTQVVDVACGAGRMTSVVAEVFPRAIGLDISEPMLSMASECQPERVGFLRGSAFELPFPTSGSLSMITAFRLYLNQPPVERLRFLSEAARVLPPGGLLLMNVHVASTSPLSWFYRADARLRGLRGSRPSLVRNFASVAQVESDLMSAGFVLVRVWRYGALPRFGTRSDAAAVGLHRVCEDLTRGRYASLLRQNFLVLAVIDRGQRRDHSDRGSEMSLPRGESAERPSKSGRTTDLRSYVK